MPIPITKLPNCQRKPDPETSAPRKTPRARDCRLADLASVVEVNAWLAGRATTPAPRLPDDASTLVEWLDDPVLAPSAVPCSRTSGDLGIARINAEQVVRRARARGALGMLPFALGQLAGLDLWAQGFDDEDPRCRGVRLGVETANENVALVHRAERDHAALATAVRAGTVPTDLGPAR
ncbi:MAG: hypothetical protein ACRDNP_10325 [Gaiellaceae bacterium]